MHSKSSVRPLPPRPNRPRISPLWRARLPCFTRPSREAMSFTSSRTGPKVSRRQTGSTAACSVILAMSCSRVTLAVGTVSTSRPLRSTVTRSVRRKISSSRWVTYRMEVPFCRRSRSSRNSRPASLSVRLAVGSSKISRRQSVIIARTISSSVRWGGDSSAAVFFKSRSMPRSSMVCHTRRSIAAQSTRPSRVGYSRPK